MASAALAALAALLAPALVALEGTLEELGGAEAVWQLPNATPKGIVLLAHGCSHSATDFWPRSASCPRCIGLPEEVSMTAALLEANWAPLALSSIDRVWRRCWNFEEDGPRTVAALAAFRARHSLEHAPLAAIGASSGGAFVLQLPALLELRAIVPQIMAIPPSMLGSASGRPFPPTLFIHMPRDERTDRLVQKCMARLREQGVHAAQIRARPIPIDPAFFSRRVRGCEQATSEQLHEVLRSAKLLGAPGTQIENMLVEDPRRSRWREEVRAKPDLAAKLPGDGSGLPDPLTSDLSAVSEELNVAWASHEIVSDHMEASIRWIESGGSEGPWDRRTHAPQELRR